jgi:3-deoxy-D-manno-octulosonate 8-phosphate phosphatase (KDO 8-P phosphatase)
MDISNLSEDVIQRASKVKLILMDCDGVLTNGDLYYGLNGEIMKVFNVKDGQGIVAWSNAGFKSGIITGRNSKIIEQRVNELGINYLKLGSVEKVIDFKEILAHSGLKKNEVAYIGDDITDIKLLNLVGFAVGVNDCHKSLEQHIQYKTKLNGGYGAVRECIDLVLMTKFLKLA